MEIKPTHTRILIHQPTCEHRCTLNHHRNQHHPTRDQNTQFIYQEIKLRKNNHKNRSAEDEVLCQGSDIPDHRYLCAAAGSAKSRSAKDSQSSAEVWGVLDLFTAAAAGGAKEKQK